MNYLSDKLANCTGIVLSGGQSSRMGQDKALLTWCGKPLYLHMVSILQAAGVSQVFVNGPHPYPNSVQDIYPGRGPLSGVHGALNQCRSGTLLVVPVDMPLLQPADLTRLVSKGDGQHPLQYEGYSLPLLLPVTDQARLAAEQAITSDNRRNYALWRMMEKLNGQTLPAPQGNRETFSNTNTPKEWQDCEAMS